MKHVLVLKEYYLFKYNLVYVPCYNVALQSHGDKCLLSVLLAHFSNYTEIRMVSRSRISFFAS